MLALLEAAASLPASTSNQPEVACLLRLLQQHAGEHDVVSASCRLLLRLLGAAPATTLAALQEQPLLALLPRLLAQQQQREQVEQHRREDRVEQGLGHLPPAAALEAAAAAMEDARCSALELLGAFMSTHVSLQRAAVAAWEPVAALFSLLLRPQAPSRRLALDNVSGAGWQGGREGVCVSTACLQSCCQVLLVPCPGNPAMFPVQSAHPALCAAALLAPTRSPADPAAHACARRLRG